MVVAVAGVQMASDDVIDMVCVGHGFVAAARAMNVGFRMRSTIVGRRARGGIFGALFEHALVDVSVMGMMQMAIVHVIGNIRSRTNAGTMPRTAPSKAARVTFVPRVHNTSAGRRRDPTLTGRRLKRTPSGTPHAHTPGCPSASRSIAALSSSSVTSRAARWIFICRGAGPLAAVPRRFRWADIPVRCIAAR